MVYYQDNATVLQRLSNSLNRKLNFHLENFEFNFVKVVPNHACSLLYVYPFRKLKYAKFSTALPGVCGVRLPGTDARCVAKRYAMAVWLRTLATVPPVSGLAQRWRIPAQNILPSIAIATWKWPPKLFWRITCQMFDCLLSRTKDSFSKFCSISTENVESDYRNKFIYKW